jgi:hypothetical protein
VNSFKEELEKHRALRARQLEDANKQVKETEARLANLQSAAAEGRRLLLENKKRKAEEFRRHTETLKRKPGRPKKWEGELGYHLICAIQALRADGMSVAEATRQLHDWATASIPAANPATCVRLGPTRDGFVSDNW